MHKPGQQRACAVRSESAKCDFDMSVVSVMCAYFCGCAQSAIAAKIELYSESTELNSSGPRKVATFMGPVDLIETPRSYMVVDAQENTKK